LRAVAFAVGLVMSLIWSLERLFDTPAAIEQRDRAKVASERLERDDGAADPPTYRCRVCGHEWPVRGYCPSCLADTMVPLPRATR